MQAISTSPSRMTQAQLAQLRGVDVVGAVPRHLSEVITPEALSFVAELSRRFGDRRKELLARRIKVQASIDLGALPGFNPETRDIREGGWYARGSPPDLPRGRVEITGPTDRKMMINALNSGAEAYMADLEDSHAPAWIRTLEGILNLRDASLGTMEYISPEGKKYSLFSKTATLEFRPRGWHLVERGVSVDGQAVPASFFDAGMFLQSCAHNLIERSSGPYLYLPKIESWEEAALWNDALDFAEDNLGLSRGTVRTTVLIETLPAAFQMHEILYALRDRAIGLNFGRWDYLFSFLKTMNSRSELTLPERSMLTMRAPFLMALAELMVDTCHKRGAHAIGGMAAQVPIAGQPEVNRVAFEKVKEDKEREFGQGFDGTWVAHPGLVPVAQEIFHRPTPAGNGQPRRWHNEDDVMMAILAVPEGVVTEAGAKGNAHIALEYLSSWLAGRGCVAIHNLMEDTATAEICRTQLWCWLRQQRILTDGRMLTPQLVDGWIAESAQEVGVEVQDPAVTAQLQLASTLLSRSVKAREVEEFLPAIAGPYLERGPLGLNK